MRLRRTLEYLDHLFNLESHLLEAMAKEKETTYFWSKDALTTGRLSLILQKMIQCLEQ